MLLSVRKRTGARLGAYPKWRSLHVLVGVALLILVVIHTGGRWGVNLNGWLLMAFMLTTFTALVGKLLEARAAAGRGAPAGAARPFSVLAPLRGERGSVGAAAPAPRRGLSVLVLRRAWLSTHVVVVVALLVLLGFHVLSVYYF
jgi:hypothetical protein